MPAAAGKKLVLLVLCAILVVSAASFGQEQETYTLKQALKEIDRAMKEIRGLRVEAHYSDTINQQSREGMATMWVNLDGRARFEVGGDNPRTFVWRHPYLYLYEVNRAEVKTYNLLIDHDMIGQYILLGFAPHGSGMQKLFDVKLTREDQLDGKRMLLFLLTPNKKKAKDLQGRIARIHLWIDPSTWLPAQHRVQHFSGEAEMTVRYQEITPENDLPDAVFKLELPDGVKYVKG